MNSDIRDGKPLIYKYKTTLNLIGLVELVLLVRALVAEW